MCAWQPITEEEFQLLFATQYSEMSPEERDAFDQEKVDPWLATIRRSEIAGDELVYVVWQREWKGEKWVLYFDDVEYGFNMSPVDSAGRITYPTCSQLTLRDAVVSRILPEWREESRKRGFWRRITGF